LAQNDVLKTQNILLPLQGPTNTNPKLTGAFFEVSHEFEQLGFNTIPHRDTIAISTFAKQALVADRFALQH
jgi:hypothetical protein